MLEQEARIAGFRSEVSKSQELHLASVTRDIERLSNQLEKIRSEIRCCSRPSSSTTEPHSELAPDTSELKRVGMKWTS